MKNILMYLNSTYLYVYTQIKKYFSNSYSNTITIYKTHIQKIIVWIFKLFKKISMMYLHIL